MGKYDRAGFLFAAPSFLGGMASVLDMGGTLVTYNISETPEEADSRALASDWAAVGDDLKEACHHFEQKEPKQK
jgi:hypothetical protein